MPAAQAPGQTSTSRRIPGRHNSFVTPMRPASIWQWRAPPVLPERLSAPPGARCALARRRRRGRIGRLRIQVIHTPGHSAGGACYLLHGRERTYLFTGDTLFFGGKVLILSSDDSNVVELRRSVARLAQLRVDALMPGHLLLTLADGASMSAGRTPCSRPCSSRAASYESGDRACRGGVPRPRAARFGSKMTADWTLRCRPFFTIFGPTERITPDSVVRRVQAARTPIAMRSCASSKAMVTRCGQATSSARSVYSSTSTRSAAGRVCRSAGMRFVAEWMGCHCQSLHVRQHPSWMQRDAAGNPSGDVPELAVWRPAAGRGRRSARATRSTRSTSMVFTRASAVAIATPVGPSSAPYYGHPIPRPRCRRRRSTPRAASTGWSSRSSRPSRA